MTLRNKTLISTTIILFCLISLLYIISKFILLGSFVRLEEQYVCRDVKAVLNTINASIADLSKQAGDWGAWDITYSFVQTGDKEFIRQTAPETTCTELKLNLMLFINSMGRVIYGLGLDDNTGKVGSIADDISKKILNDKTLWLHNNADSSVDGVISLSGKILLVASRPILTSKRAGPVKGAVIIGRYLDTDEMERISSVNHLPVQLCRYKEIKKIFKPETRQAMLTEEKPIYVKPAGNNVVEAYTFLKDVHAKAIGILRVDLPRGIYKHGKATLFYLMMSLLAVGILFIGINFLLLERLVLFRLASLSASVTAIAASSDHSARVKVPGNDELASLGKSVNRMLAALEQRVKERKELKELKIRTAELAEARLYLESIFNTVGDAIIVTDENGNIQNFNRVCLEVYGYKPDELYGKHISMLYPDHELKKLPDYCGEFIENGRIQHEALNFRKDGSIFPVEITSSQMKGKYGSIIAVVTSIRDITKRMYDQEELRKAKEDAEAANRAKTEFLANMSHEIRTPLNAIIGIGDLLAETPLNDEQGKYVQVLQKAGDNLLALINDILDLTKIEVGQFELEEIEFNLIELLERTMEFMSTAGHKKGLEMINDINQELKGIFLGDPGRLHQVLVNLVGNAIKFTSKGEIVLKVEKDPTNFEESYLRFSVSDSGIGIPPEKIGRIFETFTQVDASTTRKFGGSGLGLAICKRLVELMGGQIWVDSTPDYGSAFYFTVKLAQGSKNKQEVEIGMQEVANKRILIVDDNIKNGRTIEKMIARMGLDVKAVTTGRKAIIELIDAKSRSLRYDILLIDANMPDLNGFEVVKYIKQESDLTDIIIVMLASNNLGQDIQQTQMLGVTNFLIKPIKYEELQQIIYSSMSITNITDQLKINNEKVYQENDKKQVQYILLAEDSEDNVLLIESYLKGKPYQLDVAENGELAVGKFKLNKYDLVLMDIQMPVLDGYNATRIIREWETEQKKEMIPIIALTAHAFEDALQNCLDAGCTTYLSKPVKKAVLLEYIYKYTGR